MRLGLLLLALLASSCASDPWRDYDTSSQNVVMDPTQENYAEHIALLESWAADTEQPMPPGLYAELGYWLAKVGRYDEAEAALQKELALYPQGAKFVAALRALVIADETAKGAPAEVKPAADTPASGAVKP